MTVRTRLVTVLFASLAAGCGLAGSDGPPTCSLGISFTPSMAVVGGTLVATASFGGDAIGIESVDWDVRFDSQPVSFTAGDPDERSVTFITAAAGTYTVTATGFKGGVSCSPGNSSVNASVEGANMVPYRLRISPPVGASYPAQDVEISVIGGADFSLGDVSARAGVGFAGQVTRQSLGVPSYLRINRAEFSAEAFADATGAYDFVGYHADVEILVIPNDFTVAPMRFDSVVTPGGDLVFQPSNSITGTVLDPSGAPLVGARVVIELAGVPSSIGTTDGAGVFTVQTTSVGAAIIRVSPPAGSGLPQLVIDPAADPSAGSTVDINYSAALTTRAISIDARTESGAAAAPGAVLRLASGSIAMASSVSVDGGGATTGEGFASAVLVADGGGTLTGTVTQTAYDAMLVPAGGGAGAAITTIDLSSGNATPTTLDLQSPATYAARVVAADASGSPFARIEAIPRGLVAAYHGAPVVAVADAQGNVQLSLTPGGSYDLMISPDTDRLGATLSVLGYTAAAAGAIDDVGTVALPAAVTISGTLRAGGNPAPSVHLSLFCVACDELAATVPLAQVSTDSTGRFELDIADPGVTP